MASAKSTSDYFNRQIETMKRNPHARVVQMPNTNHYCWFDKPEQTLREMNAFLQ